MAMGNWVRDLLISVRGIFVFTVLLGLGYPLLVTGVGKMFFHNEAEGELLRQGETIIGSHWIAQKMESPRYFWPRPSAVDYNPLASGGSNLGPTSQQLKDLAITRAQKLGSHESPPQDLLFASGSGLDPQISVEAALFQIDRVAQVRGVAVDKLRALVSHVRESRQFGFLGEETVNVLELNLAMDREMRQERTKE